MNYFETLNDGAPCEGKLSCTVLSGGKSGDGIKGLPIAINTATNSTPCPTVRKQIGKTTYIVRVHFSETAKETMEDKIKRLLREEVRKM